MRRAYCPLMGCALAAAGIQCTLLVGDLRECQQRSDCAVYEDGEVVLDCKENRCAQVTCASTVDCGVQLGDADPLVCSNSQVCARLHPNCSLKGPAEAEGGLIIASLNNLKEEEQGVEPSGQTIAEAVQLAVEEINGAGGINSRMLLVASCSDDAEAAKGVEVARNLARDIGVPAIIGPEYSSTYIEVASQVAIPAGTMLVSASATSPRISGLDPLAWRTCASDVVQGKALADLVLERGYTRVIALAKDDPYGKGLLDEISNSLSDALGDDYVEAVYNDPTEKEPNHAEKVRLALAALSSPDAIVILGTDEVIDVVTACEDQVAGGSPHYVVTDGIKIDALLGYVRDHATLLGRIEGTFPDQLNGTLYDDFDRRYQRRFSNKHAGAFAANGYDAAYLVAFAASAADPEGPLRGADLVAEIPRLITGEVVNIEPNSYNRGVQKLAQQGGDIDLEGASGSLDYDLDTHDPPADAVLWTVVQDGADFEFEDIGSYDREGGTWTLP